MSTAATVTLPSNRQMTVFVTHHSYSIRPCQYIRSISDQHCNLMPPLYHESGMTTVIHSVLPYYHTRYRNPLTIQLWLIPVDHSRLCRFVNPYSSPGDKICALSSVNTVTMRPSVLVSADLIELIRTFLIFRTRFSRFLTGIQSVPSIDNEISFVFEKNVLQSRDFSKSSIKSDYNKMWFT